MKRIFYIQYTNPAGYPPLEHSSRILADAGWQVRFLGTHALGAGALRFPPHPNISVEYMSFCSAGWRQKVHYFWFCLSVLMRTFLWRPSWIYASDLLSCPIALLLSYLPVVRVLYHEHDSPGQSPAGTFQRMILWTRKQLARRADCCVLPNAARLKGFAAETGSSRPLFCVWNCPSVQEVSPGRAAAHDGWWVLYHGSIVPARLPLAVVAALTHLPDSVKLRVIGYETVGSPGYVDQLRQFAAELGVAHRLHFVGAVPHFELIDWIRRCDAGLSLMPLHASDRNEIAMTGASNKAFDYLASGLPLLVSDLPDWRSLYADPGYGLACDPQDARSIANAIRRFLDDPNLAHTMGEEGRRRILAEWNYETSFLPVYRCLQALTPR